MVFFGSIRLKIEIDFCKLDSNGLAVEVDSIKE